MTQPKSQAESAEVRGVGIWLVAIIVVAGVLRLVRVGSQLWLDEMSALNSIRRSTGAILTEWPGTTTHVLYEVLAHVGYLVSGESPIGIRLPAVIFGVAGVWVLYRLVEHTLQPRAALFATGLFALSYHHIFFSQNARGYTALIFLYLLASHLLLRAWQRPESRAPWVAYAVVGALAAYANVLGVFVVGGHAVVVLGAVLLKRARRADVNVPTLPFVTSAAAAAVATVLLYLPFLGSLLAYTRANIASPVEGPRIGLWLVAEVFEGLSAAFGGVLGLAMASTIGMIGLVWWLRRRILVMLVLIAPVIVQGVALVLSGAGIHPRYFATALPVVYLVGGMGAFLVVRAAAERLPVRESATRLVTAIALFVVVIVSAAPLPRYYRYPKQDFLGAAAAVDSLAAPGDARVGVHLAGHVLGDYGLPFMQVETLDDLVALEGSHERLWLVTTLERLLAVHDSALHRHVHDEYDVAREFPGTIGDGMVRVYVSPP